AFIRALYTARLATRPEIHLGEPATAVPSPRPPTLLDTMEDLILEVLPSDEAAWQELTQPAADKGPASDVDHASPLAGPVAQPPAGALRPAVVIGVGGLGGRALVELRCRFLDRFGALDRMPLLRFLYVDCDNDAIKGAGRGNQDVAFNPSEVYHLPLQPVAHYRRRQLDQLGERLPRQKPYPLPRSLKTQGSRALGRLAFSDNYLRLLTRLRREIQQSTHPDAIYQSVSQTGLALRDNVPRVYVIAATSGGSSGFLVDLGYAL